MNARVLAITRNPEQAAYERRRELETDGKIARGLIPFNLLNNFKVKQEEMLYQLENNLPVEYSVLTHSKIKKNEKVALENALKFFKMNLKLKAQL